MKKLLYIVALLLSSTFARAQRFNYKLSIGGGLAMQTINDPSVIKINTITTFNASASVDLNLPYRFALESGLNYAVKGGEIYQDAITTTPRIGYLEVPLLAIKKIKFPDLGYLIMGAGGYYATAKTGRYTYQTPNSLTYDKINFGSEADVQRNDSGLQFLGGLELYNHLLFTLHYDLGLKNIATGPQEETGTSSIYNRLLSLTLGYIF